MKRHADRPFGPDVVSTATQELCPDCGRRLRIYQVDGRRVQGLDTVFWWKRRDKRCQLDCPGSRPIFLAPRDLRVVLPGRIYGFDVTLHVGERHLLDEVSLAQITRDLNGRHIPIDQRHTGRVFRDFLALTELARGDDEALKERLRKQGGIVLMCDGVQFENRSPVLYLVWDALSGMPLFGERKPFRGEDDLVPLLKRVRDMEVPVIGAVSDKEKGLVPAVARVFPGVPYQFCQTHFLKNCGLPLQKDLGELQASVRRRADAVRDVSKRLSVLAPQPAPSTESSAMADSAIATEKLPAASPASMPSTVSSHPLVASMAGAPETSPLSEEALAQEVCDLVRVNGRVSGKAPLDPPELSRHERLEEIRELVNDARKKNGAPQDRAHGRCSTSSRPRSRRRGAKRGPQGASDGTPRSSEG